MALAQIRPDIHPTYLLPTRARTPKPADFDAYWDRAHLSWWRRLPGWTLPRIRVRPNSLIASTWFTRVGDARMHPQYINPRLAGHDPTLLTFHGCSKKRVRLVLSTRPREEVEVVHLTSCSFKSPVFPKLITRKRPP